MLWELREDLNWKKTFSFGHCPNYLNPPPITPIRATWSSFFGRQNSRFESQFRTKNTIYTIWYTVYMQPKKQLKVQYIGIFEEIFCMGYFLAAHMFRKETFSLNLSIRKTWISLCWTHMFVSSMACFPHSLHFALLMLICRVMVIIIDQTVALLYKWGR